MVISGTHDTIFIHVPKCAGTSVKSVLRQCGFKLILLDVQVDGHPEFSGRWAVRADGFLEVPDGGAGGHNAVLLD